MRIFLLQLLVILTFNSYSQKMKYTIKGTLVGNHHEEWIFLGKYMENPLHLDSAKIINNRFEFTGLVSFPEVYGITFSQKASKGILPLFLEAGNIEVTIDVEGWDTKSTVSGGKTNESFKKYTETKINLFMKKAWQLDNEIENANKAAQEQLKKEKDKLLSESNLYDKQYIKTHCDSPESVFILSYIFMSLSLDELKNYLTSFSHEIQETTIYKFMFDFYTGQESLKKESQLIAQTDEIEPVFLDFKNSSIIKSLIKLNPGKVLYIDIWATWCAPCKIELPYSKKLQERFKDKNLAFIYLCINSDEEECKKIINSENLSGIHFFLDKVNSENLLKEVRSNRIPTYLLVKKNGEVETYNALRPGSPEIEMTLTKLLSEN